MARKKHKKKKKHRRRHHPKFTRCYEHTLQDEPYIFEERRLQKVHEDIAEFLFAKVPKHVIKKHRKNFEELVLYIDSELGSQVEIRGTSKLPIINRLKIHTNLLKLLKKGYCILQATKLCLSI